jgi:hypothetical protein
MPAAVPKIWFHIFTAKSAGRKKRDSKRICSIAARAPKRFLLSARCVRQLLTGASGISPPIRLPETEKSFPAAVETASVSISWLAGLRQMFSLSPAWTGATAAMAALVICAGLFYVAVSSLQSGGETEVSEVNRNSSVTRSAVPTPTAPTNGTPQIAGKDAEKPVESSKPPAAGNPKSANQTANRKSATTVFERATETVKTDETPKTPKKPTANRAPRRADVQLITDKDEDDETLRLTDLFDEIGER